MSRVLSEKRKTKGQSEDLWCVRENDFNHSLVQLNQGVVESFRN